MAHHDTTMSVDCSTCPVREVHCGECMVPALLDLAPFKAHGHVRLNTQERRAVTLLVRVGLIDAGEASRARAAVAPAQSAEPRRAAGHAAG
ncbi:MAG: hypothetical protein ACRC35_11660 [Angustibacter sp.]